MLSLAGLRGVLSVCALVVLGLLLVLPSTLCKHNGKEQVRGKGRIFLHEIRALCKPILFMTDDYVVGDMVFEYEEDATRGRNKRNAIAIGSSGVWPGGVVPFTISSAFSGE